MTPSLQRHGSREYQYVIDKLWGFINICSFLGILTGCILVLTGIVLGVLTLGLQWIQAWDWAVLLFTGGVITLLWAVKGDPRRSRPTMFAALRAMKFNDAIRHGIYLDAENQSVLEARVIRTSYTHRDKPAWWFIPPWLRIWALAVSVNILVLLAGRYYGIWPYDVITKREFAVMAVILAQVVFINQTLDPVIAKFAAKPRNMLLLLGVSLVLMAVPLAFGVFLYHSTLRVDTYLMAVAAYVFQKIFEAAMWLVAMIVGERLFSASDSDDADGVPSNTKEV